MAAALLLVIAALAPAATPAIAAGGAGLGVSKDEGAGVHPTIAVLGARMLNDNEAWEPATAAEESRVSAIAQQLAGKLAQSGRYKVVALTPRIEAQIAQGQPLGACNGCETDYGRRLGARLVAWAVVQKVSNLILNLNVYIADARTNEMVFVHSVDMRGNTGESWRRAMDYLIDNYLLSRPGA